jgi:outer membrane protein OmpA-like peptidoglycan-associated protein
MLHAPSRLVAVASLGVAAMLAGCLSPVVHPKPSQAVAEARARRHLPPAPVCPPTALSTVSPVMVGFPFDEAKLATPIDRPLAAPIEWLACHPQTVVVIKPDADNHGTPAEQDALARARAVAVRDHLSAHGVAPARIRILARGQSEPAGEHFLIQAEGRRW